jgi:hypothetical protein
VCYWKSKVAYNAKSLYSLASIPVAQDITTAARKGTGSGGSNRCAARGKSSVRALTEKGVTVGGGVAMSTLMPSRFRSGHNGHSTGSIHFCGPEFGNGRQIAQLC